MARWMSGLLIGLAFFFLPPILGAEEKVKVVLPPEGAVWDLSALDREPSKLVKVAHDGGTGEVRFVLEWTRDLVQEKDRLGPIGFDRKAPFTVRFKDEDGVVIQSEETSYEGVFVSGKGDRVRVVMKLPSREVLEKTKMIAVVK